MNEWTQGASEYLEGYLAQVNALARNQHDDADEIVGNLRDYIVRETEGEAGSGMVTLDHVRRVISRLGSPDQIVAAELPLPSPARPAAAAPPPMPPPPQQIVVRQAGSRSMSCLVAALVLPFLAMLLMALISIIASIVVPSLWRAHEAAHRATCQNNLKQIGLVLKMHEDEQRVFPALSSAPGELMFEEAQVRPYLPSHTEIFNCPSWEEHRPTADGGEGMVHDQSYLYFAYIIANQEEMERFAQTYRGAVEAGVDLEAALESGASPFLRLTPANVRTLGLRESEVPVMVERIGHHIPDGTNVLYKVPVRVERTGHRIPDGANVLYMDGHVEFIRLGEKWPVTEAFYRAVAMLD